MTLDDVMFMLTMLYVFIIVPFIIGCVALYYEKGDF